MSDSYCVIGLQWGDEGKGKIVDWLSDTVDAVVRFQGGHNAGHTVVIGNEKIVFHLVPSGIMHEKVVCLIGNGVAVCPKHFREEVEMLKARGIDFEGRLKISWFSPLILECHKRIDCARESGNGTVLGTTRRGIGPVFEDKSARRVLRLEDLRNVEEFTKKYHALYAYHNFLLEHYYHEEPQDCTSELEELLSQRVALLELGTDVSSYLYDLCQREEGGRMLFEGAQGVMLDTDHGTYPFVTSTNTVAGAASVGTGYPFRGKVLGIFKAYATRVGNGPFPTELHDRNGEMMATRGCEFGATTGRPRRCGWLDLVALRYAVRVNGVDKLCLTKLDVLDEMEEIFVATAYSGKNRHAGLWFSGSESDLSPVYQRLPGWKCSTRDIRLYDALPVEAKHYIELVEQETQVPVTLVANGPGRHELICRETVAGDS